MIVVHGLRACDTCRKALREIEAAGRSARLRDLRLEPPREEEIDAWLAALGPDLLNRRSTTWRALSAEEREAAPAALMLAHPALIKRPVVEGPDGLLLGWNAASRGALGL